MKTFKSVWDAIENSAEAAESMKARSVIMMKVQKTVQSWGISQTAAARKLEISQPRLNDLLQGKIDRFSLDALFDIAARTGLKVSIDVRKAA